MLNITTGDHHHSITYFLKNENIETEEDLKYEVTLLQKMMQLIYHQIQVILVGKMIWTRIDELLTKNNLIERECDHYLNT